MDVTPQLWTSNIIALVDSRSSIGSEQRKTIESLLARNALAPLEVTDDFSRIRELAALSNVTTLVVPCLTLIAKDVQVADRICRDLYYKLGVKTVALNR